MFQRFFYISIYIAILASCTTDISGDLNDTESIISASSAHEYPLADRVKINPIDAPNVMAPAPGVTYFQIYAIGSSQYPYWEYVGSSQLSTSQNHGGSSIYSAVLQYGYGNGGATLLSIRGTNYLTELLCGPLSSIHYCSAGETVTGFMYYYSFSGPQSGQLNVYTDSSANPFGRKTDWINIL